MGSLDRVERLLESAKQRVLQKFKQEEQMRRDEEQKIKIKQQKTDKYNKRMSARGKRK